MRLFVALDLPVDVRQRLGDSSAKHAPLSRAYKWVRPENLHITLKFIGEAEPGPADAAVAGAAPAHPAGIIDALTKVSFPAPVDIGIDGIGSFPNVLYAKLIAPDSLATLAAAIEATLAPLGIAAETRPFTPHLTLARRKEGARLAIDDAGARENFGQFTATEFILYQSLLSPRGPTYIALRRFPCLKS